MEKRSMGEQRIIQMLNAIYLLQLAQLTGDRGQAEELAAKAQDQASRVQDVPYEVS